MAGLYVRLRLLPRPAMVPERSKDRSGHNYKQLRNHPCLVLWCGNNEIDWMHYTGKFGKPRKFYGKAIYHQLLPQLVAELDPDTDYIPTTPLGGKDEFKIGQPLTAHQWGVWSGHQPIRWYYCQAQDIPGFVAEFGLQSLPNIQTIKNFCPSDRLRIGSFQIEKHNYQLDGNSRLYRYVGDLFGGAEDLEQFVYLSQITQARAIKSYVEHLRAHNFRNNGVLFWQFNDCCPATSWSSIDYDKHPKALYYYTKRFFSNLLITLIPEFDKAKANSPPSLQLLNAVAINDSNQPITAMLNCRLIDLFGSLLDQVTFPVAISPFSTSAPLQLPKTLVHPAHPHKSALHLLMEKDGAKIAENLFFYLPDKYIDRPKAEITARAIPLTKKKWKFKLKSSAVVRDVQISATAPVQFDDNFIDLIPPDEPEITIGFEQQVISPERILQLRSFNPMAVRVSPAARTNT